MLFSKPTLFVCAAALLAAMPLSRSSAAETATATISSSPVNGTVNQFTINLKNTSTDNSNIGTFWFAWIPGADYMEAKPTSIVPPSTWSDIITGTNNLSDGNAIQFTAGSGTLLAAGNTDVFTFDSTETLSQLESASSVMDHEIETTSFVYAGGPETDLGDKFIVTAVPEPTALALFAIGAACLLARRRATGFLPFPDSHARVYTQATLQPRYSGRN